MLRATGVTYCCGRSPRWIAVAAVGVATLALILPSERASAQDGGGWFGFGPSSQPQRRVVKPRRQAPSAKAAHHADRDAGTQPKRKTDQADAAKDRVATSAAGPLFAVLSLSDQHISIYNSTGLVTRSKVSTGMPGHRTPSGIYSIIGRNRHHRSNIYSGAPMPFMQRITWSGIALHLGVVPGYPASHGCIRLPASFAERLWNMTKIGERVVVAPHEVAPAEIAHPLLPVPKLQPAPAVVADNTLSDALGASTAAGRGNAAVEVASAKDDAVPGRRTSAAASPGSMLNPIEYAQVLKLRAAAKAEAATKAVKETAEGATPKSDEARKAVAALRTAEAARAQAEARLAAKAKALQRARTPQAQEKAQAAKAAEEARLLEATRKHEEAMTVESPRAREALDAERAAKEARAALASARALVRDAARRASPVSILVSKKDKRVYIRQGLAPVLDAPVSIRDPEVPLGTHVYIATSVQDNGTALGWSVVAMPPSATTAAPRGSRPERGRDQKAEPEERSPPPSNAAQALERIEMPKEVSERISELLWTGGSLIVSDQPLSNETSDIGTDIVVTMR